jgi:hypothetical protein
MLSAMARLRVSFTPPAAVGTIIVTGLMGNLAGWAALLQPTTENVSAVTNIGNPAKRIQHQLEILFTFHPPFFLTRITYTATPSHYFFITIQNLWIPVFSGITILGHY